MQKNQKPKSKLVIPGIDFTPAYLQKGSNNEWRIVFYIKNPNNNKLERIRKRVKPLANFKQRTVFANQIVSEINKKLSEGWNPFIEMENVNAFKLFTECTDQYLKKVSKLVEDGSFRSDTKRAYESYIRLIHAFMKRKNLENMFVIAFNRKFVHEYLDWVYYEKNSSPRTHNNHLQFLTTLSLYLLERDYIANNPADGIKKIKEEEKQRKIIPAELRENIKDYLEKTNKNYLTLCLITYLCLIRRTEITKMKVKHINFNSSLINVPGIVSKNKKTGFVSIPESYTKRLLELTEGAEPEWFLFGENFKPGMVQLKPKKISDTWAKMRKDLNFDNKYQFYSLKDTGVTDLLNAGVPSLSVRDQARHSELATTEKYVEKREVADLKILNGNISF